MNTTRVAVAWLSDTEPVALPVGSSVVRLSDDLMLILMPDGQMCCLFVCTSTTMRVPERAAADLHAQRFERGPVQVLHDRP